MENRPSFYAIIPANVRYDRDLTPNAKLLYGEITALTSAQGYCWASNAYFANLYSMSERNVSRLISQLHDKGYISIELIDNYERKIYIAHGVDNNVNPHDKNVTGVGQKNLGGQDRNVQASHDKNVYKNNTSINNTINNTSNNKKINKKESKQNELESEFESLWKLYPRKQGNKKKAKESYIKAVKKGETTYENVKNGIEMYCKYIDYHNVSEEFIKHGSTWFNGHCWTDDYTCKPKVIQGKRNGFLGLVLNEMDYQQASENENIIDYEGEIINEQARNGSTARYATNALPFGI